MGNGRFIKKVYWSIDGKSLVFESSLNKIEYQYNIEIDY